MSPIEEYLSNASPEELKENYRKSQESRKKNYEVRKQTERSTKSIRSSLQTMLSLNAPDDIAEKMIAEGYNPMECTVHDAISYSMAQKAMRGNAKAWEMVVKLMGEDVSKTEVTVKGTSLKDLIKERMESMNGENSD